MPAPFHLAIPVDDIPVAREFYGSLLGCKEGRSDSLWVDFDFFGHQLVVHCADQPKEKVANPVDGHQVPIPHFGVVLDWNQWKELSARLTGKVEFIIEPYVRFQGQPGEQATMFFNDPAGNALEFKAFKNPNQLFAK